MRSLLALLALTLATTHAQSALAQAQPQTGNLTYGQSEKSALQKLDDVALVVNERAITRRQLNAEMARELSMLPKELPQEMREAQARENLIMWHILEQLAVRYDVGATSEEIQHAKQSIAKNNGLSLEGLMQKVKRETGMSQSAFEFQVARNLLEDKMKYGLMGSEIKVSEQQIDDQLAQLARHQGSLLHVQDILLPLPAGSAEQRAPQVRAILQQVSDALEQFPNHPAQAAALIPNARFTDLGKVNMAQIPSRFATVLVNLPIGEVTANPVVDADGMHFLRVVDRQDLGGNYRIQEYHTAHILIKHTPTNDEIAQAKMREVQSALASGQDFASVARRYSEDSVSAARGGDLGFVNAQSLLPEFAHAMTQIPPNTLSPVIKTDVGYHILVVSETRSANRNEQMMRDEARNYLYEKALTEAWSDYLNELRSQAYVQSY